MLIIIIINQFRKIYTEHIIKANQRNSVGTGFKCAIINYD
jgi:hypothetical protein